MTVRPALALGFGDTVVAVLVAVLLFVVVVIVCAVLLGLLQFILPKGADDRAADAADADAPPEIEATGGDTDGEGTAAAAEPAGAAEPPED